MNGYIIAGVVIALIVLLLATNKKLVETLKNMYKIEELRKRIFYTIGLLLVYRLGCFVVIPGINPNMLGADSALADQMNSNALLGLLDVFSGGAFANAAIFALGVMPYITAELCCIEGITNICCVSLGYPVCNGTLRNCRFETVCMSDDPVAHKSAVADTHNTETIAIHCRVAS